MQTVGCIRRPELHFYHGLLQRIRFPFREDCNCKCLWIAAVTQWVTRNWNGIVLIQFDSQFRFSPCKGETVLNAVR